ncbi:sugar transport protein [Cutibacterium acnes JCM 18916]|nr:sugar transport protein [Cutibacterium acnes JCM 18916]
MECCSELNRLRDYRRPVNDNASPDPRCFLSKSMSPVLAFFRTLFYLSAISSLVVIALAWSAILKDNGLVNNFLVGSGVINSPVPFLTGRWC